MMQQERICVSAGRRGEQLSLPPADLIRAAKAQTAHLAR